MKPVSLSSHRSLAIRWFVALWGLAIAVDTLPTSWKSLQPIKTPVNTALNALGLAQGDWQLFAPNPILRNGTVVAEVTDSQGQMAIWSSPDWSRSSTWQKFYRFPEMNYFHNISNNLDACADLADYLQQAIPEREEAVPTLRWSDTNELLPPAPLVPPLVQVKLDAHPQRMILLDGAPLPKLSETIWSYQIHFLVAREYSP